MKISDTSCFNKKSSCEVTWTNIAHTVVLLLHTLRLMYCCCYIHYTYCSIVVTYNAPTVVLLLHTLHLL